MSDPKTSIVQLPINQVQPNSSQPRKSIDTTELDELVSSIKIHGVLEPLVIAHTPAGYQIIAGERRWRASQIAGLTHIPVIIKETDPRGMLEMALIENVQRVDLNPMDRAIAFQRLLNDFHLGHADLAQRIGKSVPYISNTMKLLSLPDAIKDGLLSGQITEGHARALSSIDNPRAMIEAYKIILKESGSVRRAEDLARRVKEATGQKQENQIGKAPFLVSPVIDRWQAKLQEAMGPNAQVKLTRSRAQTKVLFVFKGTLEDTQQQLGRIMRLAAR